jgi:hypothetical protein
MRWRGGVLNPPDQERKKLLQRPASLEIPRLSGLWSCKRDVPAMVVKASG